MLSAAIVDGLLRIGLLMQQQLDKNTNGIDESLLQQNDKDKIISERWIINKAEECGVIISTAASKLRKLYDSRNRCIHRYIISDITYDYAMKFVFDYSGAIDRSFIDN